MSYHAAVGRAEARLGKLHPRKFEQLYRDELQRAGLERLHRGRGGARRGPSKVYEKWPSMSPKQRAAFIAERRREYLERNPEVRDRDRLRLAAKSRANRRLAHHYPREYEKLFVEELARLGLERPRRRRRKIAA